MVIRDEEVGAHCGHCARGFRPGPLRNRRLVQHRGQNGSGRGVRSFVNLLASHVDFYDHYFDSRRQPELWCVVVGDATQFADRQ